MSTKTTDAQLMQIIGKGCLATAPSLLKAYNS